MNDKDFTTEIQPSFNDDFVRLVLLPAVFEDLRFQFETMPQQSDRDFHANNIQALLNVRTEQKLQTLRYLAEEFYSHYRDCTDEDLPSDFFADFGSYLSRNRYHTMRAIERRGVIDDQGKIFARIRKPHYMTGAKMGLGCRRILWPTITIAIVLLLILVATAD